MTGGPLHARAFTYVWFARSFGPLSCCLLPVLGVLLVSWCGWHRLGAYRDLVKGDARGTGHGSHGFRLQAFGWHQLEETMVSIFHF